MNATTYITDYFFDSYGYELNYSVAVKDANVTVNPDNTEPELDKTNNGKWIDVDI